MEENHQSGSGLCGHIEKLKGTENFANWKFKIKNYLELKGWWWVVGNEVHTSKQKESLIEVDTKVRTTLCLLLEPDCFTHVYRAKTAKEVWDSLCKAYEDKGWGRRIMLQRKIWQCKLENFESMEKYISEIMFLSNQLNDIDAPIDDDWIVSIMLSGLSEIYNPLIMAIDNSGQKLSLEQVKTKLMQEANRQRGESSGSTSSHVLMTKKSGCSKTNQSKFVFKCFKCHKRGHKASECNGKKENTAVNKYASICMSTSDKKPVKTNSWFIDSGCSHHMTHDINKLFNYQKQKNNKIRVANGEELSVHGGGNANVKISANTELALDNVLHVPELSMNLISVSKLIEKDYVMNFNKKGCIITKEDKQIVKCQDVGGIFELKENQDVTLNVTLSSQDLSNLWHKRLAHLSKPYMNKLRNLVNGIEFQANDRIEPCIPCIEGKTCKKPFKNTGTRANNILELVHSDICGPMEEPSFSGSRYMLLFIDDFTRKTHVYFLQSKSQTFDKFREYKAEVEKEMNKSIKCLRTDNGSEYCNRVFDNFLKSEGIKHQTTAPYTPEQNSVAERANRTIIEKARTLLSEANLRKKYWAEAVNTVVYLKNRSPTKAVKDSVPEELWTGKKVDLSHLKVFGCLAYGLKPKQKRQKFDSKTVSMIFVGYPYNTKGYRLMDRETNTIHVYRDVKFIENIFPGDNDVQTKNTVVSMNLDEEHKESVPCDIPKEVDNKDDKVDTIVEMIKSKNGTENNVEMVDNQDETKDVVEKVEPRYNLRSRKKPDVNNCICNAIADIDGDPVTIEEALARPDGDLWQKAIDDEIRSLKENETWKLVQLPKDKKPIHCKWVFKIKKDSDGNVVKYKARLVAKGFTQVRGVDYNETYSPVVRSSTLRLLFSLAAEYDWFIDQWDVNTAFLYGKLKEDIYMLQPKGAVVKGKETMVCKLQRSLYGLKQASNAWFNELDKTMLDLGFIQSKIEPCLYHKNARDNKIIIVVVYVDDIFVFGNSEEEKLNLKVGLLDKFKLKDLGPARHVLGMRLRRENGVIFLDQEQYILNVLNEFGLSDCKPAATPMEVGLQLEKGLESDMRPYQNLIGCLNYLAVNTRPDIAHALSVLSQFNSAHDESHYKAAQRVLRYLKGTSKLCLKFEKSNKVSLHGYVDADWGGAYDRKSFTGFIFKLGCNLITWESRKQQCVSLSSTESEYVGLCQAAKEAVYLRNLLGELLVIDDCWISPVVLYNDNQSCHKIANNKMNHNRTKHIDIKYHYIREAIASNLVKIEYLPTEKMVADILTKCLHGPKIKKFLPELCLKIFD